MKRQTITNIALMFIAASGIATNKLRGQVAVLDVSITNVQESSPNCPAGPTLSSISVCPRLCTTTDRKQTQPAKGTKDVNNDCPFLSMTGDIVAVNGQSVSGRWTQTMARMSFSTFGSYPGLSGTPLVAASEWLDFWGADGAEIGDISAVRYTLGARAFWVPGFQSCLSAFGNAGIYDGARGYMTSYTDDAGQMHSVVNLLSAQQPTITTVDDGPAVFDSTMTQVSTTNPARIGQPITLMVTGLGLTTPNLGEQQPFPTDSLARVNAPLQAMIGGKVAEVIAAVGWPGQVAVYRVDLQVPDDLAAGMAAVQLVAAFIPSLPIEIPIQ